MHRKGHFKILFSLLIIILFLIFTTLPLVELWIEKKIASELRDKIKNYTVAIGNVHISIFTALIELDNITLNQDNHGNGNLKVEIDFVKFKGIHFAKFLFKKQFDIREVVISGSNITGEPGSSKHKSTPIISQSEIQIENLFFDNIEIGIHNRFNAQVFFVRKGALQLHGLRVKKQDTISISSINHFELNAEQIQMVSSDSMYTIKSFGVTYSAKALLVKSFSIQPNLSTGDFEAKHKFQTDRFKANFSAIKVHDFSAAAFLKSGDLISSGIEIGEMRMDVFRDNRKEFNHVIRHPFQEMIYRYTGAVKIDSITLSNGNITYTEHVLKASDAGTITFEKVNAKIYNITNDVVYKSRKGYLHLNAMALLMGRGKLIINLKSRIYDQQNTFFLDGSLGSMYVKYLNPLLEKNAFVYATSGKIDVMKFNFAANNNRSNGTLTLLYHGLDIAVKNKRTNDTTAIKERIISFIANRKVTDSNPVRHESVRVGIISYDRDPERFLFNYCFKSILTGIKSTIVKSPGQNRKG
jgi:hypothetical protein